MTDIGEAISIDIFMEGSESCPFCDAKVEPKIESHELINDSAELAKNIGKMSLIPMKNPEAEEDYYIFNKYWCDQDESYIGMNAHHVIPGNATLATCPDILQWLAGKVTFSKKFHDRKLEKEVACIPADKRHAAFEKKVLEKYKSEQIYGDVDMLVSYSVSDSSKSIFKDKTVNEEKVYGCRPYDVNCLENGIWLPSNNAISGWADVKNVKSVNIDGDEMTFAEAYAYNAMAATGKQFHDAHPAYSDSVLEQLQELEIELGDLAIACHEHDSSSNGDDPYPAPARIEMALNELSSRVAQKLDLTKSAPDEDWVTSSLVLKADYQKLKKHFT